jgi:hypothetical protein
MPDCLKRRRENEGRAEKNNQPNPGENVGQPRARPHIGPGGTGGSGEESFHLDCHNALSRPIVPYTPFPLRTVA